MNWVRKAVEISDTYALLTSAEAAVSLWDLDPTRPTYGKELARFTGDDRVTKIAILPGRNSVLVGDEGGGVHLLEVHF